MKRDLSRLLRPKSIALFGGGWAVNVITQLQKSGFDGDIWPVHPKRDEILGIKCFKSIDDLPAPPDASFIGVNRDATIDVVAALSKIDAGGATCFASGFLESEAEGTGGADLQQRLVAAAGDMPIIGPNCYGLLNYLDTVTLWPDQHGGQSCDRGVGIIAQSSNIAINMTMQHRGLPIAYVIAAGNQAQTGIAEIGEALIADNRVSAIGFYLEGFGDIRALEAFAEKARIAGKQVVVLKIGRSEKAQLATMTHTASLAGDAAVSSALIKRLGFIEVQSISVFLETLKLLNSIGPLNGNAICSVSCSGGEASLIADLAPASIEFRDFSPKQRAALKSELGPIVTVANPLDYHTFIWGDVPKMTAVFAAVMEDQFDLCVFILDIPREDRCDPSSYDCAIEAILAARKAIGANVAVLTSLSENLSEKVIERFAAGNVVCLNGMEEGLSAIAAGIECGAIEDKKNLPVLIAHQDTRKSVLFDEKKSKEMLAAHGVAIPISKAATSVEELMKGVVDLQFPAVLKGLGVAHKTEAGAVAINLTNADELENAALKMTGISGFLAEEMVSDVVAEILVGVTRDATGLLLLTIGAGGVLAELLEDTANVLLPATDEEITKAIKSLKLYKILQGYRGKQSADIPAIVDQIAKIANYAAAHKNVLIELDVNPLMACHDRAIAVDALIRMQAEGN
ncbi:MAG: acetate--CoA ligase family protein [Salaquimonas sp.]